MTLRHKIKFAKVNYLKKKKYYQAWNFDSVLGQNEITPWRGEEAKLKGKKEKGQKKKKKKQKQKQKQKTNKLSWDLLRTMPIYTI